MSKYRKTIGNWKTPSIQALMRAMETQSKTTLAHWATDYAEAVLLPLWFKQYPEDPRPLQALEAARAWLSGSIKLPQAKIHILACHAAAREAEAFPAAQAAARAIGQSTSTIHSARHAIGLAFYGALAVAYDQLGTDAPWAKLEQCAAQEVHRMRAALLAVSVQEEPEPAKIDWKC